MTPPDTPGAPPAGAFPAGRGTGAPGPAASDEAAGSVSRLEATLRDIVRAAIGHVDATHGALAVLTADGREVDRLVVVGPDDAVLARLVADPAALRLDDRGGRPGAGGSLDAHPAMRSVLGVPVRAGDSVLGTLHLAGKRVGGSFTPADAEVAEALAAMAGPAVITARAAEAAERRRYWEQAALEMTTALLSGTEPDHVLRSVSARVSELTGADLAGVLMPSIDDEETMTIVAAVGRGADEVEGVRVPLAGTFVGATYRAGVARLVDDISILPVVGRREAVIELTAGYGPTLLAPLGSVPERSLLVTMRAAGREPFHEEDLQLLSGFAERASVALELSRAQQRERALQVQADRDRIARDLHDHVVQRIFATALSLDRLGRSLEADHPEVASRLSRSVDDLHGTIVRIRTSIFELHQAEDTSSEAVRTRLADVVRSVTEGHDLRAELEIRCEPDEMAPDLVLDLVAVVRELVTNVVRHARARRLTVAVEVGERVRVWVTDDGRGLPPIAVRSGLANLAARAERRGGALHCRSGDQGTEIEWTVPRPRR